MNDDKTMSMRDSSFLKQNKNHIVEKKFNNQIEKKKNNLRFFNEKKSRNLVPN